MTSGELHSSSHSLELPASPAFTVAHSSDLHLAASYIDESVDSLKEVLEAARRAHAAVLLLAGDVFDHNAVRLAVLDKAARALADAELPVIILPGNHDCLTVESVYRRGGLSQPSNVTVMGIDVEESLLFPELDLEVWGRAHLSHSNFSPLANPRRRSTAWQIAVAHGHWATRPSDEARSWLIKSDELNATGCDYVALGHWDQPLKVGGPVPAYYSGSPSYARTLNVVSFTPGAPAAISRVPLQPPAEQPPASAGGR